MITFYRSWLRPSGCRLHTRGFSAGIACFVLLFLLSAPAKAQIGVNKTKVVHGKLPLDREYWEFNRWYRNHSVLQVLVNGSDRSHLLKVLGEVEELADRGVEIGNIYVIEDRHFGELDLSSRRRTFHGIKPGTITSDKEAITRPLTPLAKLADRISLTDGKQSSGAQALIKQYDLKSSPTWIVEKRGEIFIYEGAATISKLFARDGSFRGDPSDE